jgi:hypothetical protein
MTERVVVGRSGREKRSGTERACGVSRPGGSVSMEDRALRMQVGRRRVELSVASDRSTPQDAKGFFFERVSAHSHRRWRLS